MLHDMLLQKEILEGRAIAAQQQQRIVRQPPNIPPQLMQVRWSPSTKPLSYINVTKEKT